MISTFSGFIYGFTVDEDNRYLDFKEGGAELSATVAVGSYSLAQMLSAVQDALNQAGARVYTLSASRSTRKITIAATGGNFSLLTASGSHFSSSIFSLLGFTGADRTGAATYLGNTTAGSYYAPQFKLQKYISKDDLQQATQATVNKTASGRVEVIKFGTEKFYEMNITYITNIRQDNSIIKTNLTGVADARAFMQYAVLKAPFDFIPDVDTPTTFDVVMLETTTISAQGTGYQLNELYDKALPGYFETGKLRLRVIE